jgi:DNA invertase Pin-like site-specific DNA recombinase
MKATKTRTLRAVAAGPPGAVLYIRQSITQVKKDDDGHKTSEVDTVSPELQEHAGRAYAASKGYHVVAVITDLNRTGRTLKRRSVQEAIGHIERGEARVIIVWKWSRLARSRRDFAVTCDTIETLGGRVESSTEPADTTTATGRLNRGILAEFAAFESERVGEIIREVQDNRVRQGLPGNGKDRFGYRNINKRFEVDPDTGPALAHAYRAYIGGAGYTAIARWLNDHGHTTTYGSHFRHGTVRLMLDSGFGAGLMLHRGELVQGIHEPVITAQEWQRYIEARDRRTKLSPRAKASRYLLVGLIKCGVCGFALTVRPDRYGHFWYRCKARSEKGCTNPMVKLVNVEAAVFGWLQDLVDDIDAAAGTVRAQQERIQVGADRAAVLRRKIGEQDAALTRLTMDRARNPDLVPEHAYIAARDEFTAKRARLVEELDDLERSITPSPTVDVAEYRGLITEWPTIPLEARREALRRILQRVRVWGRPLKVECVPTWADGDGA